MAHPKRSSNVKLIILLYLLHKKNMFPSKFIRISPEFFSRLPQVVRQVSHFPIVYFITTSRKRHPFIKGIYV